MVKTIVKNGKRVSADQKGKRRPPKQGTPNGKKPKAAAAPPPPPPPPTPPKITKPVLIKPKGELHAFPAKVCAMLSQIRAKRQNAQNEERSMVKRRKELEQWFTQNGDPGETCSKKNPSPEDLRLHAERRELYHLQSAEYKRTNDAIKASRVVQSWLAEKSDALVDMGMEGRLSDDHLDDAIDEITRQSPAMPLFGINEPQAPEKGAVKPGSSHLDTHSGKIVEMRQGWNERPTSDLTQFGITREVVDRLVAFGRETLGQVDDLGTSTVHGISAAAMDAVRLALKRVQRAKWSYLDEGVEFLLTVEQHGHQLVSDSVVACLKKAEVEKIRQITKVDGIYGLSDGDKEDLAKALDILEKRHKSKAA
jgi:hypothetical protein